MISPGFKRISCFAGIVLLNGLMIFGCTSKVTTGPFKKVEKLETALKRGISTKADVKKLLGEPNGYGHSFLPVMSGQKQKPNEIWYYENIEAIESRSSDPHVVELDVRQQILLIFFDQDIYDGFMWYTNAGKGIGYGTGG